jgi:serine/threonine-protein kinase
MIQVGQTIGNYEITAKLGEGGMGVVYLATHPVIGRKVAMKAIHPELSRNPEVISRFMTEAKSVNQIGNEHIVDISDFGTTSEGEFYFIMEFLQGEALADRLRRERVIETARALRIGAQVADALAASHSHGIIHRDLKPENIFLVTKGHNPDFVKVLDFGLAKLTQGDEKVTHKTRTGSVMGTPYYMAPEQCEGKPNIDPRADIYSLGVILFEMMTGKVPFGGEGYGEIIVKHITQAPPSPRAINPGLTPAQELVLLRALEKRREDRFQSMEDFRAAMLDPEGYAAGAPAPTMSGAYSVAPEAGGGGHARLPTQAATELGAQSVPMPSTFRDGLGEVMDEDLAPRKSRAGIIVGAVLAAAIAGVGAFVFLGDKPAATATDVKPAPAPVPPPVPPKPTACVIAFSSNPPGATVLRKDTNEALGTTPFEHTIPYGTEPLTFVFSKEGFEDKELRLVPDDARHALPATLRALPAPVVEKPVANAKPTSAKAPAKKPAPAPAKPGTGKPRQPLDEDAVLAPSFIR